MENLHKQKRRQTAFIALDTRRCTACWKCIDVCSKGVLTQINLFFHKHVKLRAPENCMGCMKCVKVCEANALTKRILERAG